MQIDLKEFPLLLNDSTIKYLFKNPETRLWLIDVIKYLTDIDLSDYTFVDNELNSGNNRKDYRMDLALKKGNNFVIIEANTSNSRISKIKDYQYLFRVAGDFYENGEIYTPKYARLIRLINTPGKENVCKYTFKNASGDVIDFIASFEIYLAKYQKLDYNKASEIEKRLMMLGASNKEDLKKYCYSKESKRIFKELEELKLNDEFMGFYYNAAKVDKKIENSKIAEVREELREEVKEEVKKELTDEITIEAETRRNLELAKDMYQDGMPFETISKYAHLSIDYLKKIL